MSKWSFLTWFYLAMAIAGAIVPWYFNYHQLAYGLEPFTLANFLGAGFENDFVSSISSDFFIATTAMFVWMIVEARRLRMKNLWVYILFTFVIAFAFTCPLFLFNRERLLSGTK